MVFNSGECENKNEKLLVKCRHYVCDVLSKDGIINITNKHVTSEPETCFVKVEIRLYKEDRINYMEDQVATHRK